MKPHRRSSLFAPSATGFSRRRFLSLPALSAGLALPGVMRPAHASMFWDALDPAARSGQLSLAYWLGSDQLESFDELSHAGTGPLRDLLDEPADRFACTAETCAPLVDARRLPPADARLADRGATLRIHGRFAASSGTDNRPEPMTMYVHSGPGDGPSFLAWSVDHGNPSSESPPTQFQVPAHGHDGLHLSCEFDGGSEATGRGLSHCDAGYFASTRFVHLQLGDGWAQPRLRRGVYLLAWRGPEGAALPQWSGYHMAFARPLPPEPADDEQSHQASGDALPSGPVASNEPTNGQMFSRLVSPGFADAGGFSYLLLSVDNPVAPVVSEIG